MNVSISVPGTFHAFHSGEQLERRDALATIYTTYPRFKLDTSVPKSAIRPIRYPEGVSRLAGRIPLLRSRLPLDRWRRDWFDASVARKLSGETSDVFVGYSGSAFQSIEHGNDLGMTTVLERCSSHIRAQATILDEEYQRYGYESGPVDEPYVEHEEAEYRMADYVMTPSEFVYESFLEQGVPEDKVLCVPYAVDTERYKPRENSSPNDSSDDTVQFLFAGRVDLRKGIPYLLQAWESVDLENAELVIAGVIDESVESLVEKYREREDLTFLGWTDDIDELYRDSSVFVFPTLEEGSAYVTYEAMASGLPVITTSHSGWVGSDDEHGIEVPIRDVEALKGAILRMVDARADRQAMGKRARELVTEHYTWADYGERIFEVYRNITETKG